MLGGINAWRLLFPEDLVRPTPTPTSTPAAVSPSPVPVLSPSPIDSPSSTVSPIASTSPAPTPIPSPGFEAAFAIAGLLTLSYYFILKRRKSDKR